MKLYSWNVNGIRAVIRKGNFLTFFEEHQPDILCVQETKAHPEQVDLELPGYHAFWNSAARKGYSGTAIFTKAAPLKVLSDFPEDITDEFGLNHDDGFGVPDDEGRVLVAEYEDFYLTTVYTPNSKRELSRLKLREKQWDPAFLTYCQRLESEKPVIFCGDLNVAHTELDLANPKRNEGTHGFTQEERNGFQNFVDAGFVDTFRMFTEGNGHYSWWSHWGKSRERNTGWRIDYFLVSQTLKNAVESAAIHADVMGSDHCPVSVKINL